MPDTVREHAAQRGTPAPAAPRAPASVAQGGPVAALQRSIQDRIGALDLATAVLPAPADGVADRLATRLSRAAGWAALAAALGGVALAALR